MSKFSAYRSVLLLAATFCMALGFIANTVAYSVVGSTHSFTFDKTAHELPAVLCCHDAFSGGFTNTVQPARSHTPRKTVSEFLLCALEDARVSHTEYVQHVDRVRHLRIDQRKSDMVYPYHDFW